MNFTVFQWGQYIVEVTLSDLVDDPNGPFDMIWVPGGSDVTFTPVAGPAACSFLGVYSGAISVPVRRVHSTGTTVPPGAKIYGVRAFAPLGEF